MNAAAIGVCQSEFGGVEGLMDWGGGGEDTKPATAETGSVPKIQLCGPYSGAGGSRAIPSGISGRHNLDSAAHTGQNAAAPVEAPHSAALRPQERATSREQARKAWSVTARTGLAEHVCSAGSSLMLAGVHRRSLGGSEGGGNPFPSFPSAHHHL